MLIRSVTPARIVLVGLAVGLLTACGAAAGGDFVSPAATRAAECSGGYPLGSAVFDEQSGFAFEKIDWLRGEFTSRDWMFGQAEIDAQCQSLAVTWSMPESMRDSPIQVELLRAIDSGKANAVAIAALSADDSDTAHDPTATTWGTSGRYVTAISGCIVGRVESRDIARDGRRLEDLIRRLSDLACPEDPVGADEPDFPDASSTRP